MFSKVEQVVNLKINIRFQQLLWTVDGHIVNLSSAVLLTLIPSIMTTIRKACNAGGATLIQFYRAQVCLPFRLQAERPAQLVLPPRPQLAVQHVRSNQAFFVADRQLCLVSFWKSRTKIIFLGEGGGSLYRKSLLLSLKLLIKNGHILQITKYIAIFKAYGEFFFARGWKNMVWWTFQTIYI